jgi:hypothetical protein
VTIGRLESKHTRHECEPLHQYHSQIHALLVLNSCWFLPSYPIFHFICFTFSPVLSLMYIYIYFLPSYFCNVYIYIYIYICLNCRASYLSFNSSILFFFRFCFHCLLICPFLFQTNFSRFFPLGGCWIRFENVAWFVSGACLWLFVGISSLEQSGGESWRGSGRTLIKGGYKEECLGFPSAFTPLSLQPVLSH